MRKIKRTLDSGMDGDPRAAQSAAAVPANSAAKHSRHCLVCGGGWKRDSFREYRIKTKALVLLGCTLLSLWGATHFYLKHELAVVFVPSEILFVLMVLFVWRERPTTIRIQEKGDYDPRNLY